MLLALIIIRLALREKNIMSLAKSGGLLCPSPKSDSDSAPQSPNPHERPHVPPHEAPLAPPSSAARRSPDHLLTAVSARVMNTASLAEHVSLSLEIPRLC